MANPPPPQLSTQFLYVPLVICDDIFLVKNAMQSLHCIFCATIKTIVNRIVLAWREYVVEVVILTLSIVRSFTIFYTTQTCPFIQSAPKSFKRWKRWRRRGATNVLHSSRFQKIKDNRKDPTDIEIFMLLAYFHGLFFLTKVQSQGLQLLNSFPQSHRSMAM